MFDWCFSLDVWSFKLFNCPEPCQTVSGLLILEHQTRHWFAVFLHIYLCLFVCFQPVGRNWDCFDGTFGWLEILSWRVSVRSGKSLESRGWRHLRGFAGNLCGGGGHSSFDSTSSSPLLFISTFCWSSSLLLFILTNLRSTNLASSFQTSQELRMLSSVTINCQITKIVMNSGSQLSEL